MSFNNQSKIRKITEQEFNKLGQFIYSQFGIKMPSNKRVMLESRLQKRLRTLEMTNYSQYIEHLFSKKGLENELETMLNLVTTNKTDFFREADHFTHMIESSVPEFLEQGIDSINIWSAGCSSGEEAYTIAMVLENFCELHTRIDYKIYCTDLSTDVIKTAKAGIYPENRVNVVPKVFKKKYMLHSKDKSKKQIRMKSFIRNKLLFKRLNFMDKDYKMPTKFDIIFFRNVMIYFDKKTQNHVINGLCKYLNPNGIFYLGHSETLNTLDVPLKTIIPTIYRRI